MMIQGKKQFGIYLTVLAIVSGGIWYFVFYRPPEAKIFIGTVNSVSGSEIIIQGLPSGTRINPSEFESGQIVTVKIDSETKIIKETGPYKLRIDKNSETSPSREDVTRERTEVSLTKLEQEVSKQLIFAKVVAGSNIYQKDNFTAKIIYYNLDGGNFANY